MRALARDLGERLGSAAYLGALTRTASGPFTLEATPPLDAIRAAAAGDPAGLSPLLRPIDAGLDAFPVVTLTADEVAAIARGQFVRPGAGLPGPADTTGSGRRRRAGRDRERDGRPARARQGLRRADRRPAAAPVA